MNYYRSTTDASTHYRDTSAVSTIRSDGTSDTGSLLEIMRDAVVIVAPHWAEHNDAAFPISPEGDLRAVAGSQSTNR